MALANRSSREAGTRLSRKAFSGTMVEEYFPNLPKIELNLARVGAAWVECLGE